MQDPDLGSADGDFTRLPPGDYRVAAGYLLPNGELTRCVQTVEAFAGERGHQQLELELRAPQDARDGGAGAWYLPLYFFGKTPVAPDLAVRDAAGAAVPMPTKIENQALTERAVQELAAERGVELDSELSALVHDVIFGEALLARISRYLLETRAALPVALARLLASLEDQFVLWVAVPGDAALTHRFVVTRSLARERKILLRRHRRREHLDVPTAVGSVRIAINLPTGRPYLRVRDAFERLLLALGTHIVTFYNESDEAPRFASFHMRAMAPAGFIVRQVVADGAAFKRPIRARDPQRLGAIAPGLTVQGNGSELGHIHVAEPNNPTRLGMRIALVLRSELIGFWALVVVLTAILLWLFQDAGVRWLDEREGALEGAVTILLLAPSAASALALRAEEGGLVRRTMFLTRMTLFGSALLSIATALVLLFPASEGTRVDLVGDFATAAYVLAAIILVSWTLGQRWVWLVYERLLDTRRANLMAVAVLAAATALLVKFTDLPDGCTAVLLLTFGLGFAAVATNRMLDLQGRRSGPFIYLASLGAVLCVAAAGLFIDYFENYAATADARSVLWWAGIAIAVLSLLGACRNEVADDESIGHAS